MKYNDETMKQFRDLLGQKRRVLNQMKKHRKALAKARVDKKKLNEQISRMRRSGFAFAGMSAVDAKSRVEREIRSVTQVDIYPRDLEKKFDKLEQASEVKYRGETANIDDLDDDASTARAKSDNDDAVYSVSIDPDTGIVDFSEQGSGKDDDEEPGADYESQ